MCKLNTLKKKKITWKGTRICKLEEKVCSDVPDNLKMNRNVGKGMQSSNLVKEIHIYYSFQN